MSIYYKSPDGKVWGALPKRVKVPGVGIVLNPSWEHFQAAGWIETDPPPAPPSPANPLEEHAATITAFQAEWAAAGMTEIPEDWTEAMSALEAAEISDRTLIKLLALRLALAPVWDLLLAMQTGHEGEEPEGDE